MSRKAAEKPIDSPDDKEQERQKDVEGDGKKEQQGESIGIRGHGVVLLYDDRCSRARRGAMGRRVSSVWDQLLAIVPERWPTGMIVNDFCSRRRVCMVCPS